MVAITTITKTISRCGVSITTISSISQTMPIRYGGSSIGGDLSDGGGGSVSQSGGGSISQSGGGSVSQSMCCRVADLGNMGSGGGCYGCHSGGGGVAKAVAVSSVTQTGAVAVPAVAKTCDTSLFLLLFSKGTDGQSKHDTSLERAKQKVIPALRLSDLLFSMENLKSFITLHIYLDYEIQIQCQQMSYAVRCAKFCKGRNFRRLAFLGLSALLMDNMKL